MPTGHIRGNDCVLLPPVAVSIPSAMVSAFVLAVSATLLGVFAGRKFLLVMACYTALTILYSLVLKVLAIIDVVALSVLYTLRVIAGGVASGTVLSPWTLAFSLFAFLALAFLKRYSECVTGNQSFRRSYEPSDAPLLLAFGTAASMTAAFVLALYVEDTASTKYDRPYLLWVLCPLFVAWMGRMWLSSSRGKMTDDPIIFAAYDRFSRIVLVATLVLLVIAR